MTQLEPRTSGAAIAAQRSELFRLLSAAYRYPTASLSEAVAGGQFARDVAQAVAGLSYELPTGRAITLASGDARGALDEAYTHLFDVGSVAGPPCCLYEGEYGGGRLGVMEDVLRFYHCFGLRLSAEFHDRPDHLATELEFLHWLTFREAEALERGSVEAARSFRSATRDFLTSHTAELTTSVARQTRGIGALFYPELTRLTAEFCALDLQDLREARSLEARARVNGGRVALALGALQENGVFDASSLPYDRQSLRAQPTKWDRVVKASHTVNCWYQRACNFNLFVSDGIVLREEQAGNYPEPNDPDAPDPNPRGCNKGACFAHRTYDPARVKYPLKRVGARGEGRWQRISWDQALTEIADQFIDVITTDGPETIVTGGWTQIHANGSEGMVTSTLYEALGIPMSIQNPEIGDDHQGAGLTFGKIIVADSADNWLYSNMILVWSGNPAYTNIPNYHYIAEARYRGTRVVTISPDYSPSAIHSDLWVPLKIGTDAALALGMCQVIVREGLHNQAFIREQTDLPLLVRVDNGRLLREKDVKRGGRDDAFYLYDEVTGRVVEAPRKSLALNGLVPALEGQHEVPTLQGLVQVRPVFEVLRDRLDRDFTPDQASRITGAPASVIEQLAREIASARGVVNISTSNPCKFYHGDLIERAMILVFALCGHMGRKGASYSAFPYLSPDTGVGAWERHGHDMLQSAAGTDPRYAAWKEDGYTAEMMLGEYVKDSCAAGALSVISLISHFHGGLLEMSERHQSWDPHLKRPVAEYVAESLAKGWQVAVPPPEKAPRVLFQWGGNYFRRARATRKLIQTLLPKLKLVISADWRMTATSLHADYVLPICAWYERTSTNTFGSTQSPFFQINDKAVDPLYESLSDFTFVVRFARKIVERAKERGIATFTDRTGKERRFDLVEDRVTQGGLYTEDDEEAVARDVFVNSGNREQIDWEEFKERGIARYTSLGSGVKALNNACDLEVGEPLVPLTWHVIKKEPYPTLTRRMQFYIDHDWYLELGEELPTHKDSPKAGGDYPLQVTGGHARWSVHTMNTDDAVMLALQRGEPAMFMNTGDAALRSITDGDYVEVFNDVGDFRVRVVVSPQVRPGQVMIYHGWENFQFDGWRHFQSVLPSALNPIEMAGGYGHVRADAIVFTPGMHDRDSRVEVSKAD